MNANIVEAALTDTSANSNTRSWRDFVSMINGSWRKGAGDFIACGRHLIAAKDELARDAFNAMVKKLDFASSVARRLECIASNETLCSHANRLPPCWSTLYYLSQLPESVLKAAITDDRIHPGMKLKDALALKPGYPDVGITNPTYLYSDHAEKTTRLLRDLIRHFLTLGRPFWLLIYSDWMFNENAAPFIRRCSDIVAIGRVRWIPDFEYSGGYENASWFRFDANHRCDTAFHNDRGMPAPVYQNALAEQAAE